MRRLTKAERARFATARDRAHAAWMAINNTLMSLPEDVPSDALRSLTLTIEGAKRQAWIAYDRLCIAVETGEVDE